jgi:hypothetical protein
LCLLPLTLQQFRGRQLRLLIQLNLVDPIALVYVPRYIAVGQKRPTWARHNLQEEEGHATSHGTF